MRKRCYDIFEGKSDSNIGQYIRGTIHLLIVLNIISLMAESHYPRDSVPTFFTYFEAISVTIFSAEYILRMWCCVEAKRYQRPLLGRLRYIVSPLALVDLIAILPFFLPLVGALDLRATRAIRLFRLMRFLKLGRYSRSMQRLGRVLHNKRADLASTLFVVCILLIVSSSLMYFAEHQAQPEKFPHISAAIWWGINTVTTVGYGDIVPVTVAGQLISGFIAILGLGLFALPAGIISAGYQEMLDPDKTHTCPQCGFDSSDVAEQKPSTP